MPSMHAQFKSEQARRSHEPCTRSSSPLPLAFSSLVVGLSRSIRRHPSTRRSNPTSAPDQGITDPHISLASTSHIFRRARTALPADESCMRDLSRTTASTGSCIWRNVEHRSHFVWPQHPQEHARNPCAHLHARASFAPKQTISLKRRVTGCAEYALACCMYTGQ